MPSDSALPTTDFALTLGPPSLSTAPMPEHLRTGVAGLDDVLDGGLLSGHSLLLQGSPGSGRTALGLHLVVGAARDLAEPGVVLSFEPFPALFLREANGFGFDLPSLEMQGRLRVIFARPDDLHSPFAERESEVVAKVTDAVIDLGARRVLIDSGSEFFRLPFPPEEQLKQFVDFVRKLKQLGVTPILTGDAPSDGSDFGREESAVDSIMRLSHAPAPFIGGARLRSLEVVKARGQRVLEGRHPIKLTSEGVRVYPYAVLGAAADISLALAPPTVERLSTGTPDLDDLLNGGLQSRSSTLILGVSGTGKTTLAMHFVQAGLAAGESAVWLSLGEHADRLLANASRRGLDFASAHAQGALTLLHAPSTGVQPIQLLYQVRDALQSAPGPSRVVVDGLRELVAASPSSVSDDRERHYLMGLLADLLIRYGATAVLTHRVDDISGLSSAASAPHTGQVDNILYLGLTELQSRLHRVLGILKTRGEASDAALRELVIGSNRVSVASLFTGMTGMLLGATAGPGQAGGLSEAAREVLEPLIRVKDFLHGAQVETPEQARQVIGGLRKEFDVLAEVLSRHINLSSSIAGEAPRANGGIPR